MWVGNEDESYIGVLRSMPKIKDTENKNISTTKPEFVFALKKVSQRINKPKALAK